MSLPEKPSLLISRVLHTEGPSFLDKLRGGLGTVVTTIAKLAREALSYQDEAAARYVVKPNIPNLHSTSDFSTYHGQSKPISKPNLTPLRPMPNDKPSRTGRKAVAQIQHSESFLQKANQWQAMQDRALHTLNQLAHAKGLPSYAQFHQENSVADKVQPGQGLLGVERFISANSQFHGLIPEDVKQISQNLSYAQRPLTLSDQLRNRQVEIATEQAEYTQQVAMQNHRQQQWTSEKAAEIIGNYGRAEAANYQELKRKS